MEFEVGSLSNGIKVVHAFRPEIQIAHLGVFVNAGSRDELKKQHGLAHFTEHCLFKGTTSRKFYHILNRMDSVGGELDAYTTKEDTCIYSSFLNSYYKRSAELISDIITNSTFPESEIDKEKAVILDEIQSYKDSPYDQIYDDFERLIFRDHPIGRDILGNEKDIANFDRKDVSYFFESNYDADNLTISSMGNLSMKKAMRILEQHFGKIPARNIKKKREPFNTYRAKKTVYKRNTNQAHLALGTLSYSYNHPLSDAMVLLNNVIGGPALNNKLNLHIREKYGYAYQIESQYTQYSDTGVFFVYAGTDHANVDKIKKLIFKELNKFVQHPPTSNQLTRFKRQYLGQIAISRENNCNQMLAWGKSLSARGKVDTIDDIHERIMRISENDLHNAAIETFVPENFSELIYL